jgi:hypothetical protein
MGRKCSIEPGERIGEMLTDTVGRGLRFLVTFIVVFLLSIGTDLLKNSSLSKMERLETIYQVMTKIKNRFGSPREAFNKLVTG